MKKYVEPCEKEIIEIVKGFSSEKIYEIGEINEGDYEITVESFSPILYETLCCDRNFEWVAYGSHESTIAFGGDKLIAAIKQLLYTHSSKFDVYEQ